MRYALLTPTFFPHSGIDRAVEGQAKMLKSQGHEVTVFCFAGATPLGNIPFVAWGMPQSILWQRIFRLCFFLHRKKIATMAKDLRDMDAILCHFYPMSVIGLYMKRNYRKKFIYYEYGVPPVSTFNGMVEKLYITFFKPLARYYAKRADKIIAISKFLAEQYPSPVRSRVEVEHVQIDTHRFHSGINGQRIRALYGLEKEPVVLYVGRLSPHKGIHLLIQAFSLCRQKFPYARLLIVGQSSFVSYKKRLEKISDSSVIFAGFVPDGELPEYYAASTVYATASLWEGYDMPLAEAQACGKRVVAFDVGSHREVIDQNGILVTRNDIHAFSQALIKQISHVS